MVTELKSAAVREIGVQIGGVDHDTVTAALARDIVNRDEFDVCPEEAVEAGVEAAIEESDDATFDVAVDVIQTAVAAEVERQAKEIALRMLRQLAATAEREEVVRHDARTASCSGSQVQAPASGTNERGGGIGVRQMLFW